MLSSIIALASIFLGSVIIIRRRYFHPLSRFPGPFLASTTDLWRFYVCFILDNHHITDEILHDTYGPIVRIGPNTLSFSTVDAAKAIYGHNKSMTKGTFYACFGDPDPEKANMFQTRTAQRHHEIRRKLVSGALVPSRSAMYEPIVSKTVGIFIEHLNQLCGNKGSMVVNLAPRFHLFAMDTFFEMSHGISLDFQTMGYDGHGGAAAEQRYLTKSGFRMSLLPWLATVMQPISYIQMVRKATYGEDGKARGFYAIIDASKRAQANALNGEPVMEVCILKNLSEVDPNDDRRMEGMEMWKELFNASMAGTGSISACLTMIFYHLGMHREWQTRILLEIEASLSPFYSGSDIPSPNTIPHALLAHCPSLDAVIKESLRVSPPFPASFPRDIAPGAEHAIPGLAAPLPLGTTVQANVYVVGRERGFWGDDAGFWKPERWMEVGDGKRKRLEDGFIVFGRGSRNCVGRDISFMALRKVVFALLAQFEVLSKPESLKGRNYFEMQYEQLLAELRPRGAQ